MQDTMARFRALARAQTIVTRIELRSKVTQGALYFASLVIGMLGVVMINLAGFLALSQRIGYAWAAVVFAAIDVVLAAILVSVANRVEPGPEVESATQVRDLLLDEISTDAEALKAEFMEARADVQRIRNGFSALVGGAKGLGPVVDLLTGALRKKKKA